ncbi:hypothetical protein VST7929_01852 [Vibrio stylophorae]|uniref:DNA gyrase subunit B n=1 Tax=Vibrio stylophorae TaxID=659351 RepID=A0ABM8ZUI0_9VIBR|nr:hypothetical protein [Vibrio stylophorae]CAH0533970.1 hypothetical protein VST7929_01852 [Vibrio stylophorae]
MRWLTAVSAGALLIYPFAVYFGLSHFGFTTVALLLGGLFVIRLLGAVQGQRNALTNLAGFTGAIGLGLCILAALFKQHAWFQFYPVAVSALMLCVFAYSLSTPQPIIERLARLREPELDPQGVRYTRTVTKVWCGFFVINGSIALATCFAPLAYWTLYNGLLSYLLAGSLFVGEWFVRARIRKQP